MIPIAGVTRGSGSIGGGSNTQTPVSTRIRVHLHMGQSNKVGHGVENEIPPAKAYLADPISNVSIWRGSANGFQTIDANTNTNWPLQANTFGSEVNEAFLTKLFWNDGSTDYVIKWAYNATEIAKFSLGGGFYNSIVTFVNDALAAISANENDYSVVLYWDQGENDANQTLVHAQGYRDDFAAMITDYRSVFNVRKLPVVMRLMRNDPIGFGYISEIRRQQQLISSSISDVVLVNGDDLVLHDGVHFDTPSLIELGKREMQKAIYLFD